MACWHFPARRNSSARCSGSSGARGDLSGGSDPPSGSMFPVGPLRPCCAMTGPAKQTANERSVIANPTFIPAPVLSTGRNEYTNLVAVARRDNAAQVGLLRGSCRFVFGDKTFPTAHILHECRTKALLLQIFTRDWQRNRAEIRLRLNPKWKIVMQDGRAAKNGKVCAMRQNAAAILTAGQLPCHAQARLPTRQLRKPVDQGFAREFGFNRFLENVPQRHIQIVDVTGA